MKKWLIWGIPSLILVALIVWRFSTREETAAGPGGAPGGGGAAARGGSGGAGGGGGRPGGGAGGPGGGGPGGGGRAAPAVELAVAAGRTIQETIESVGNVESPFRVQIAPKTTGRIEFLAAREGDRVRKGDVLLRIDPTELQAAVSQAEANVAEARSRLAQAKITQGATNVGVASQIKQQQAAVASAQADLNQVQRNYDAQVQSAQSQVNSAEAAVRNAQANLEQEQASLRNAQTRYDRTHNLYTQGFIAAQDVDDARTALDVQKGAVAVAQGQVDSARSQLNVQKQNLTIAQRKGTSDIAASRARLTQARATLDVARANRSQTPAYRENLIALQASVDAAVGQLRQAQSRLADTAVRSSIDGTVTSRTSDPGALASPGTPVLEVQFLDWLYVTTTIPIEATTRVREGQTATIKFDALPNRTFQGAITNVNPAADPQSRQFGIRIRLPNPNRQLRPGMYGTVSIVTRQVEADVVVPREAVRTDSKGVSTVTVVDKESTAHVREVKLGAQDARGAQILSGIQAGERVVVLSFSPIRDGQKVALEGAGGGGRGAGGGQGGPNAGGGQRRGGGQ